MISILLDSYPLYGWKPVKYYTLSYNKLNHVAVLSIASYSYILVNEPTACNYTASYFIFIIPSLSFMKTLISQLPITSDTIANSTLTL